MAKKKMKPIALPHEFVDRVRAHVEASGFPLIETGEHGYTKTIVAWPEDEGYRLVVPEAEWEPPFNTWREYANYAGLEEADIMDEQGFESEAELDDEIDLDIISQLVDPEDSNDGAAAALLRDLPLYLAQDDPELGPDPHSVKIHQFDIGRPGWNHTSVEVGSAFDVSVLQYLLDEGKRGIRIEVAGAPSTEPFTVAELAQHLRSMAPVLTPADQPTGYVPGLAYTMKKGFADMLRQVADEVQKSTAIEARGLIESLRTRSEIQYHKEAIERFKREVLSRGVASG